MVKKLAFAIYLVSLVLAPRGYSFESSRLIIHAVEPGVAGFHRIDNKLHPYPATSVWHSYVLSDEADTDHTLTVVNSDGSVTIMFLTLEELLAAVVRVSKERSQPVSVLNVHAHGVPGGTWFPRNAAIFASIECLTWRHFAEGSDQANYDQYYRLPSIEDINATRTASTASSISRFSCVSGLQAWQEALEKTPELRAVLAPDVRIRFLACVVGLGTLGEAFVRGLADLLLRPGSAAAVEAPINFTLGDWSMPEGMGFWDYATDDQSVRDGKLYRVDRQDREVAQKGAVIRSSSAGQGWLVRLFKGLDFVGLGFDLAGEPLP